MKNLLEEVLKDIYLNLGYDLSFNIISESNRKELCDFQINSSFGLSKILKKAPLEIASIICEEINKLDNFNDYFKSVSCVAPGFINIVLSDNIINIALNNVINNKFGITPSNDEVYFLDYGGPNIAKPLHIGHLRPAIIGESLKRILNLKGYKTISDAHFGDFGLQMGQVVYGILKDSKDITSIDISYLNMIYPKISALCKEDEKVLEECKKITKDMQDGNMYGEYLEKIIEVSLEDIKRIYNFLGVSFDLWLGERDSYSSVKPLIEFLKSKNLVRLDDGAYIIDVKKESDTKEVPPLILLKSDGAVMYSTTDLATIYDRVNKYKIDHMLYVVDARQDIHFEQVFRASDISGLFPYQNLEHIKFGTINGSDNKPFKTRSGDTVKLDDLIKETKDLFISKRENNKNLSESDLNKIVNSILKFADLSNSRDKNYIFDLNKFSEVSGKTGPYILYTALRIKKILNDNKYDKKEIISKIYNESDRNLRVKLTEFDKYLNLSVKERMPHFLCEYVFDLCNIINNFYQNNNIKNEEDLEKKNDYLNILDYSYKLIEVILNALVIEIPNEM
ncbi:MAG: arginine--tRNA ligase [Bacilli bacterium]|nr:arginine--tRNA ligase [Bacilli bacterium]